MIKISENKIIEAAEERFPEFPDDGTTTHMDSFFEDKQDAFIFGANWMQDQINIILEKQS